MHQIEAMFAEMLLKMDEHNADITALKRDVADLRRDSSQNRTFQIQVIQAIAQQSDSIEFLLKEYVEIKETIGRLDGKMGNLEGKVGGLDGKMDNLEGKVNNKIDNLEGKVDNLTSLITKVLDKLT